MTSATSMSLNVDNNPGTRIDMEGGGGSGVIHGVPPPPPVPPSPLVPSVAQGMGDPTGGGAHGGGDLPGTNSLPISQEELQHPLPKDLQPLPVCPDRLPLVCGRSSCGQVLWPRWWGSPSRCC